MELQKAQTRLDELEPEATELRQNLGGKEQELLSLRRQLQKANETAKKAGSLQNQLDAARRTGGARGKTES